MQRYQQALAVDATAPVAANNLAWIYAQRGDKLDDALQLARAAKSRLPESAAVADTLGWVYYKRDLHPLAVAEFKHSVDAEPEVALFHYHLGLAYAKTGELALARKALEQGLKLDPKAPEAAEARDVLTRLAVLGS